MAETNAGSGLASRGVYQGFPAATAPAGAARHPASSAPLPGTAGASLPLEKAVRAPSGSVPAGSTCRRGRL